MTWEEKETQLCFHCPLLSISKEGAASINECECQEGYFLFNKQCIPSSDILQRNRNRFFEKNSWASFSRFFSNAAINKILLLIGLDDSSDDGISCEKTTCRNGGTCFQKDFSYECHCQIGFFGSHCQFSYHTTILFLFTPIAVLFVAGVFVKYSFHFGDFPSVYYFVSVLYAMVFVFSFVVDFMFVYSKRNQLEGTYRNSFIVLVVVIPFLFNMIMSVSKYIKIRQDEKICEWMKSNKMSTVMAFLFSFFNLESLYVLNCSLIESFPSSTQLQKIGEWIKLAWFFSMILGQTPQLAVQMTFILRYVGDIHIDDNKDWMNLLVVFFTSLFLLFLLSIRFCLLFFFGQQNKKSRVILA